MNDEAFTILYNPACGTSRNALRLLNGAGVNVHVRGYPSAPLTRAELSDLVAALGAPARYLLREKEALFRDLGLNRAGVTDGELLDALAAHPVLLNRPVVITGGRARVCRPADVALDLIPPRAVPDLNRTDGSPFLRDAPVALDERLRAALAVEPLPVDLASDPGRTFFRYHVIDGAPAGYAGFDMRGTHILLRAIYGGAGHAGAGRGAKHGATADASRL